MAQRRIYQERIEGISADTIGPFVQIANGHFLTYKNLRPYQWRITREDAEEMDIMGALEKLSSKRLTTLKNTRDHIKGELTKKGIALYEKMFPPSLSSNQSRPPFT